MVELSKKRGQIISFLVGLVRIIQSHIMAFATLDTFTFQDHFMNKKLLEIIICNCWKKDKIPVIPYYMIITVDGHHDHIPFFLQILKWN